MSTLSSTHCSQLQQPTLKGVATLSTDDAVLIVLAVHLGLLRALTHHFGESQAIDSGDVFVFRVTKGNDPEGIARLRDGRHWSPRRQDEEQKFYVQTQKWVLKDQKDRRRVLHKSAPLPPPPGWSPLTKRTFRLEVGFDEDSLSRYQLNYYQRQDEHPQGSTSFRDELRTQIHVSDYFVRHLGRISQQSISSNGRRRPSVCSKTRQTRRTSTSGQGSLLPPRATSVQQNPMPSAIMRPLADPLMALSPASHPQLYQPDPHPTAGRLHSAPSWNAAIGPGSYPEIASSLNAGHVSSRTRSQSGSFDDNAVGLMDNRGGLYGYIELDENSYPMARFEDFSFLLNDPIISP